MIEPNGIHYIRVDKDGKPLSENNFLLKKKRVNLYQMNMQ